MPVAHCCVPGCFSSSRRKAKLDKYPEMKNVMFFRLPDIRSEYRLRNEWIRLINREPDWEPNQYTRICSLHFIPGDLIPTKFPYDGSVPRKKDGKKPNYKTQFEIFTASASKKVRMDVEASPKTEDVSEDDFLYGQPESFADNTMEIDCQQNGTSPSTSVILPPKPKKHQPCTKLEIKTSATNNSSKTIKSQKEGEKEHVLLVNRKILMRDCFIQTIMDNDKSVKHYTGLPSTKLLVGIFNTLKTHSTILGALAGDKEEEEKEGEEGMTTFHEYLLTLLRLRLDMSEVFLADVFNISPEGVAQVFTDMIQLISEVLGRLVRWPTKEEVLKQMPTTFKTHCPNARAVIDCVEFTCRKKKLKGRTDKQRNLQRENICKCLLAVSPSGAFTFVSKVYDGKLSNRFITKDCGFLDLVEKGDSIVAGEEFHVQDLLKKKRATLLKPPKVRKFFNGKVKYLNIMDIRKKHKISKLKMRHQRATCRLKSFQLLVKPISRSVKPVLGDVLIVTSFLSNLLHTSTAK